MDGAQLLPEGHYWSEYVRTDDPLWIGLRSSLIGFASIGPGFTPQFVGTGFVIATSGDGFLLVLTAKHVIADGVIEVQKPYSRRAPSAPDILFEPEQPLIGPKELRAVWMGADCADMLLVRHVSYAHNLDVALCVLEAQPELSAKIHKLAPAIA